MTANVTGPPANGGFLPGDRVMRGITARWSDTTSWVDRDGLPLPDTMLVVGYTTVLRRWVNKKPIYITEHPLPDPDELNAAIPIAEWEIGLDGKPTKPWKLTYVVYLVDLVKTGALYTYAADTFGASLLFTNLEEQIAIMRMLRGEHVFPIVHLERRPMKTQFGMRTRPHLQIIDWRAAGAAGGVPAIPQSPAPQLSGSAAATPTPAAAPTTPPPAASAVLDNTKPVKPVTVAELIADELPPWA